MSCLHSSSSTLAESSLPRSMFQYFLKVHTRHIPPQCDR